MKKFIITAVMVMMCVFSIAHAQDGDVAIKLIVDNKIVPTETVTISDRTLVPLRALMESTGAAVEWYGETSEIDVIRNGETIRVQIDNNMMKTAEGDVEMDVSPVLHNGDTTYVPLRAICEAFDFAVDWDEGTKTILINAPDGIPYVDLYNGMTLGEYLEEIQLAPVAFAEMSGLDYEMYKDTLYVLVDNSIPLRNIATINGLTPQEAKMLFGLDETTPDDTAWGEALGEITIRTYIEVFSQAGAYGIAAEELIGSFRDAYNLGEEYTLDTKFKYVRTIMETMELQAQIDAENKAKAEADKKAAAEAELAALCENKIFFTITLEDGSVMKGELYPDVAPITVANFVALCEENFYEGLIFHRVIDDFMIQGGGYDKDMNEKKSSPIVGEFYDNGYANALKHERGVLSMARTNDPNSASSEFFIMDEAAPHLDGSYAAFGRITEGFDVLDKIATCETQVSGYYSDVPVEPIVIKSIVIEE